MRASALLFLTGAVLAWGQAGAPTHRPAALQSPVEDKNFYLLTALERTPGAREAVEADPALARAAAERQSAIDRAVATCGLDIECNTAPFRWSDAQIEAGAHALAALYRTSTAVRSLAEGPLRAGGMYVRYGKLDGAEMLKRAFTDCMRGVNRAIEIYGLGKPPRYAAIDSITYDPKSELYRRMVHELAAVLQEDGAGLELAFSPSLRFAVELMILNHRDEAGRFEPLEAGENAAAFRRAQTVNWARYPYSAIVVPGSGNDRPGVRLSPAGRLRDRIAAKRFREGKAPFILVSGGYVHPNQTEYCEATEMKWDLMRNFGIPEEAIIVDPHARHTTTNLRNAARLLYRYGIPFGQKALISTDSGQSQYISSVRFTERCMEELGYMPVKLVGRTSAFDLEFVPLEESLEADPRDPLDP